MLDLLPDFDHGLAAEQTQIIEVGREVGESSSAGASEEVTYLVIYVYLFVIYVSVSTT